MQTAEACLHSPRGATERLMEESRTPGQLLRCIVLQNGANDGSFGSDGQNAIPRFLGKELKSRPSCSPIFIKLLSDRIIKETWHLHKVFLS